MNERVNLNSNLKEALLEAFNQYKNKKGKVYDQ